MAEFAFSTDDAEIVAAYRTATDAARAAGLRAIADADALGRNDGPAVSRGMWGLPDVITGLFPIDRAFPPDGWGYVAKYETLRPKRGKAGEVARGWLADHTLLPDARAVLVEHGLPHYARSSVDGMRYTLSRPAVVHHEGTLWARYRGVIDGECTWTPRKMSEFYAAEEDAAEAFEGSGKGVTP